MTPYIQGIEIGLVVNKGILVDIYGLYFSFPENSPAVVSYTVLKSRFNYSDVLKVLDKHAASFECFNLQELVQPAGHICQSTELQGTSFRLRLNELEHISVDLVRLVEETRVASQRDCTSVSHIVEGIVRERHILTKGTFYKAESRDRNDPHFIVHEA